MKKTKLTRSLLAACSIVALSAVMYGCTSDGSENDLIATQGDLEDVTAQRDAALASAAALQTQLDTANTNADGLQTMLDAANATGAGLQTDLDAANATAAGLQTDLDAANGTAADLQTDLDAANGEVTRLEGELMTSQGNEAGLQTDLDAANAMAAGLQTDLDAANGTAAGLQTDLDAANATAAGLQTDLDAANGTAAGLQTDLDAANGTAAGLQTDLDAANAEKMRIQGLLDAANARIAALEAGTHPALIGPLQTRAMEASTMADTAKTEADTAAGEAEDAIMGRAMYQTGEANSDDHADMARMYAGGPDDDADDDVVSAAEAAAAAAAALAAANAATNAKDARDAVGDAEDAQDEAEDAQEMAEEQRDMAEMDAMEEVFVKGKVKNVGDRKVDFDSGDRRTVTEDDETTITRMQREIMDTSEMVEAIAGVPDAEDTDEDETEIAKPAIAVRDIGIGAEFDSEDDDARVTLIDSYIDTRSVSAYADDGSEIEGVGTTIDYSTAQYDHDINPNTLIIDVPNATIRTANGKFIESGTAVDRTGTIATTTDAAGITLYYYVDIMASATRDDDEPKYLRRVNTVTAADRTVTYTYQPVNVVKGVENFPVAKKYDRFHFGVWSNLEEAEDDGTNDLDDLGIGFLTVLDDGEMTEMDDMPKRGDANFAGNWVANVQAANPSGHGSIMTQHGKVAMEVDFGNNDVDIELTNLAVLDGKIDGNEFSGTDASYHDVTTNVSGLASDGDFEGSFEGGFFKVNAVNAGGVFMFTSDDDNEEGAFAGSFGAVQQKEGPVD